MNQSEPLAITAITCHLLSAGKIACASYGCLDFASHWLKSSRTRDFLANIQV